MKRWLLSGILFWMLVGSPVANAAIADWPVIGQVIRVSTCVIGDVGKLTGSLVKHLGAWGGELLTSVGQCSLKVVETTTDLVVDVVNGEVPVPTTEVVHE